MVVPPFPRSRPASHQGARKAACIVGRINPGSSGPGSPGILHERTIAVCLPTGTLHGPPRGRTRRHATRSAGIERRREGLWTRSVIGYSRFTYAMHPRCGMTRSAAPLRWPDTWRRGARQCGLRAVFRSWAAGFGLRLRPRIEPVRIAPERCFDAPHRSTIGLRPVPFLGNLLAMELVCGSSLARQARAGGRG